MVLKDINAIRSQVLNAIKTLCYEKREFTLVSGKKSNFYIDLRKISFDGDYLYDIGRLLYTELIKNKNSRPFDVVAGVPIGGLPLVSSVLISGFLDGSSIKAVVIRKEKKDYGKKKLIEPSEFLNKGSKIMIIEDVVTTGASVLSAVNSVRNEGYAVTDALCVVDRQEGGGENLKNSGVNLLCLFTKAEIEEINGLKA